MKEWQVLNTKTVLEVRALVGGLNQYTHVPCATSPCICSTADRDLDGLETLDSSVDGSRDAL